MANKLMVNKAKIKVQNPIIDIQGDEMTRIIWHWIKQSIILPFVDVELLEYDLSIQNRDATGDKITIEAANAIKRHKVGVKCATITPTPLRMQEFGLKKMWPSPNGTIRNILGGTVFRKPIIINNVPRLVSSWKKPIVVARHAFADQYKATEINIKGQTKLCFKYEDEQGNPKEEEVFSFQEDGIAMAMYNLNSSIKSFAEACFNYALAEGLPVYLSTKNTILKNYDGTFVEIFQRVFDDKFAPAFKKAGLTYEHRLIDDMVAFALKNEGGFLWACKNYDGDVQSDSIAQGFGSLGLMTSILTTADGTAIEAEAAHGTVTRHYRQHQKGEKTSTNPIASIFAWANALFYRGKFDANNNLMDFAKKLEIACTTIVEENYMTKDLAMLKNNSHYLTTEEYIAKLSEKLTELL